MTGGALEDLVTQGNSFFLLAGQMVHGGAPMQRRDRRRVGRQRALETDGRVGKRAGRIVGNARLHPAPRDGGGISGGLPAGKLAAQPPEDAS